MTGNFDYNTTIADMDSVADLTPFWEAAEAKQISDEIALAEWLYYTADRDLSSAPEWYLEKHSAELWAQLEEAEAVLASYGIDASLLV